MWHMVVSKAAALVGQLTLGFVNTCGNYPILTLAFLVVMVVLVCTLWIQTLNIRLSVLRSPVRSEDRSLASPHSPRWGKAWQPGQSFQLAPPVPQFFPTPRGKVPLSHRGSHDELHCCAGRGSLGRHHRGRAPVHVPDR